MTLTVRSATVNGATTKGSALSHAEMDENWNHVANFTQSGSATAESVQSRLRWMVFITDYLSDADRALVRAGTTVNINSAFSDAHSALPTNGGEIIFPAGKVKFTAKPTITKRVRLRGSGISESAGATGTTVVIKDAAMTTVLISLAVAGCEIDGIEFEGENGNTGDGVEIKAGRCALRNVASYSMGGVGIRVGTDSGGENCNLWYMERVKAKSNGSHGIYIHDGSSTTTPNVNGGTLIHPDCQSNTGSGVYYGSARLNTQIGGASQSNTVDGVHLSADAKFNSFYGGDWESNTNQDLVIDSGATNNRIFNDTLLSTNCTISEVDNKIDITDLTIINEGIRFPAAQVASSNANTLDDYEETDFSSTVDIVGTSDPGAATYTTRQARATKVGNRVYFTIELAWSAHTGTGNARITGLPYTSAGSGGGRSTFAGMFQSYTYGAGIPAWYLADSATVLNLFLQTSGGAVSAIALDTAATVTIEGSYQASA